MWPGRSGIVFAVLRVAWVQWKGPVALDGRNGSGEQRARESRVEAKLLGLGARAFAPLEMAGSAPLEPGGSAPLEMVARLGQLGTVRSESVARVVG